MLSQACLFTTGTTGTIIRSACLNKYTTPSISRVKPSSIGVNPSNVSVLMLLVPKCLDLLFCSEQCIGVTVAEICTGLCHHHTGTH